MTLERLGKQRTTHTKVLPNAIDHRIILLAQLYLLDSCPPFVHYPGKN